jgi:hypothetical protein
LLLPVVRVASLEPKGNLEMIDPDDIIKRLQNFDPQPIEPGYLGEEIAKLMDDAASLIEDQARRITDLKGHVADLSYELSKGGN